MTQQHGGSRPGAGRPRGQGKYKEPTKAVRLPVSRVAEILSYLEQQPQTYPLYASRVSAGFPTPADDYIETHLDLNQHLIKHPAATFFLIASGDSMIDAGIPSGSLLIVDKSLEATHGKIVIAALNGELTVKRLSRQHNKLYLLPENKQYPPIDITHEQDIVIWGVVTHVIHQPS